MRCLHCYSQSSPQAREELSVALLTQTIKEARQEGYNVVSFSGGEPTLYQPLGELLDLAHQLGMSTTVVSNGMLWDSHKIERWGQSIDLLAISLDGQPTTHNQMRGSDQAFEKMVARLPLLRHAQIPFGFLFTLTHQNFRELDWVVPFALEQGAALLQIHPLAMAGRAKDQLSGLNPSHNLAAYTFLQTQRWREKVGDQLRFHIDLVPQEVLRAHPEWFLGDDSQDPTLMPLADLISPLVIEADGQLVPLQYGFAQEFGLGNLKDATLSQLSQQWKATVYGHFLDHCKRVYSDLTLPADSPIVDWYSAVSKVPVS